MAILKLPAIVSKKYQSISVETMFHNFLNDRTLDNEIQASIEAGRCANECGKPWVVTLYKKDTDAIYGFCKECLIGFIDDGCLD